MFGQIKVLRNTSIVYGSHGLKFAVIKRVTSLKCSHGAEKGTVDVMTCQ